jgi:hypothetical protein
MTHKNRKKSRIFMFLSTGCSLLRTEGVSCSLGVHYGGLGTSKLQFLIKKIEIKISSYKFFSILGNQTLDPFRDPDRNPDRNPDPQLEKMLDPYPDPHQINALLLAAASPLLRRGMGRRGQTRRHSAGTAEAGK